jgi:DNA-binding MarR family transcriptional regulator
VTENFFHQQLQFTRSFKKRLNEELQAAGLFHSQWLVLYCIQKMEPVTQVEISAYLDVEKPTISRTVRRLTSQGLLADAPSSDKREKRLRLTPEGHVRFKEGEKIVMEFETALAKEIDEAKFETTLQTIQQLQDRLKQEEMD